VLTRLQNPDRQHDLGLQSGFRGTVLYWFSCVPLQSLAPSSAVKNDLWNPRVPYERVCPLGPLGIN